MEIRVSNPPYSEPSPTRVRIGLTRRQQFGLAVLGLGIGLLVLIRLLTIPTTHPDPLPPFPTGYDRLADRIDPNVADAGELAVLPGIGPSKADGIIAYRDKSRARGQWPAFERVEDLEHVYGIGPAIVEKMRPYVIFEKKRGAVEIDGPAGD